MRAAVRGSLALLVGLLWLGDAAADELVGKYQATGTTPGGKAYSGQVQIEQLGGLHVVLWKLTDGEAYKGVGIRQGNVLGAAYGPGDFGIVVYQVNGGTLTGTWATSGDLKSELGKETLQGDPGLNGLYKITLGENRDGLTNYGGEVEIHRNGESYIVAWPTKPPAIGIGVRLEDALVVAYTSNMKNMPGVVAYHPIGNDGLAGIWSVVDMKQSSEAIWNITAPKQVGHEDLQRAP